MFRSTVLLIILLLSCTEISAQKKHRRPKKPKTETRDSTVAIVQKTFTDSLLEYAEKFLGAPYSYGSAGTKSFDCSGYVMHVYGKFGIALPHSSGSIASICEEIKPEDVKPGDFLFFSGRKSSGKTIGHVSMVYKVEKDKITMIHATVQSGVIIEQLDKSEYFSKRFIKAGRLKSARRVKS